MSYWRTVAGFSRDVRVYIAVSAIVGFTYFGIVTTILNLYTLRLGFEPRFVGVITGAGQLVGVACAIPLAWLSRRIGPRNGIAAALAFVALGIALALVVEPVPQDMWAAWLIASSIVLWLGAVLFGSSAQPYLMGVAQAAERTHAFAVRQMVFVLMSVAGSLVGGLLPGIYAARRGLTMEMTRPFQTALWLAVGGLVFGAILILWASPITRGAGATGSAGQARPPVAFLAGFTLVVFLGAACVGARMFFFNMYLDAELEIPVARIGLAMGLGGLLGAFTPLAAPPLVARLGTARVVALATLALALAMALIGAIPTLGAAVIGYLGAVGFAGLVEPNRILFGLEEVTAPWRTTVAALSTVGTLAGWAFISLAGSRLIAMQGFASLYFLAAALGVASAIAVILPVRAARKDHA